MTPLDYPGPAWSPYLAGTAIGVLSWLTFCRRHFTIRQRKRPYVRLCWMPHRNYMPGMNHLYLRFAEVAPNPRSVDRRVTKRRQPEKLGQVKTVLEKQEESMP